VACLSPHVNFYANSAAARQHLEANPDMTGHVIMLDDAVRLAAIDFAPLLARPA
jgi:hypothetical protein